MFVLDTHYLIIIYFLGLVAKPYNQRNLFDDFGSRYGSDPKVTKEDDNNNNSKTLLNFLKMC